MRISSLPMLGACPGWWLLKRREPGRSGVAADTGSAAGAVLALYHAGRASREALACALAPAAVAEKYRRADVARATRLCAAYMADPRNPADAVVPGSCEAAVALDLADAAGAPLRLEGHVDQVRANRARQRYEVWDVKSGVGHEGAALLGAHALQLAGYAAALAASWRMRGPGCWPVVPGGIVWLAAYERPPATPVLWEAAWGLAEAEALLDVVRHEAAELRAGRVRVRPGPHCAWCPAGSPAACIGRFRVNPPRPEEVT